MMAPLNLWRNGKVPPRRMFIDLTRDSEDEDEDEDEDAAGQVSYT
jgi:histone-lysine N-methyltransferase SUV39H